MTTVSPAVLLSLDSGDFIEAVTGHSLASAEVASLVDRRIGQLSRLRGRTGR